MDRDLKRLVKQAKEYGEVLFNDGDILESEAGYIDSRTRFDIAEEIHIVKPLTLELGFYSYVCPDCSQIHVIHKRKIIKNKPIRLACCKARSHSKRVCVVKGELVKVQRFKIILDVARQVK